MTTGMRHAVVALLVLVTLGVWVGAPRPPEPDPARGVAVADAVNDAAPREKRPGVANQPRHQRAHGRVAAPARVWLWHVASVVDGDTVVVRTPRGAQAHLRLIGIDTPERGSCGYAEATDALAAIVLNRRVALTAGAVDDRDRYGRLLRYVDVKGVDAGLAMIQQGLAVARYDSRDGYGHHPREERYVRADASTPGICGTSAQRPPAQTGSGVPSGATVAPGPDGSWNNCTDARAAGAAPVYRGDAGYGAHLDGDGDGIGCE